MKRKCAQIGQQQIKKGWELAHSYLRVKVIRGLLANCYLYACIILVTADTKFVLVIKFSACYHHHQS